MAILHRQVNRQHEGHKLNKTPGQNTNKLLYSLQFININYFALYYPSINVDKHLYRLGPMKIKSNFNLKAITQSLLKIR